MAYVQYIWLIYKYNYTKQVYSNDLLNVSL